METSFDERAKRILAKLSLRGGFDNWWDGIDRPTRKEIEEELAILLAEFEYENAPEVPLTQEQIGEAIDFVCREGRNK